MIETLTAFKKRLIKGVHVRQIWNSREGTVNYLLTIEKVQTQEVAARCPELAGPTGGLYWLAFHKRIDIEFTEKGWIKLKDGKKMAEYEWVEQNEKGATE